MAQNYWLFELDDDEGGLIALAKRQIVEYIIKPLEAACSKTAIKAYLTTALISISAFALLILAFFAYILFYWSYIPRIGFERPIYLQFDNVFETSASLQNSLGIVKAYPYGYADITPDIISKQKYDVAIEITLPRTVENKEAGNFMLDVTLRGPEKKKVASDVGEAVRDGVFRTEVDENEILARSRRPAILSYRSRLTDLAYRITEIQWYILGARQESEKLKVSIFEGVSFAQGWRNIPSTLRLEIQSVRRMQIYDVKVNFRARFTGLRWFMYNYQLTATVVFVSWFWATEMLFAAVAWAVIVYSEDDTNKIEEDETKLMKKEPVHDEDEKQSYMSDTERTFPTLSGQAPLRYQSPDVKQEEMPEPIQAPHVLGLEADDEDEDADFFVDSGLGTGLESDPLRSSSVRKRSGRTGLGER